MSSSALPSSSPPKVTTRLVPSPISCSCACAAITSNLAAGCATSSSRTMTAASEVTKSLSRWLMTILFMPVDSFASEGSDVSAREGVRRVGGGRIPGDRQRKS